MAQFGSASGLGPEVRGFKSLYPDHIGEYPSGREHGSDPWCEGSTPSSPANKTRFTQQNVNWIINFLLNEDFRGFKSLAI